MTEAQRAVMCQVSRIEEKELLERIHSFILGMKAQQQLDGRREHTPQASVPEIPEQPAGKKRGGAQ